MFGRQYIAKCEEQYGVQAVEELLNTLYDRDMVTDGFLMELLSLHTSVPTQLRYHPPACNGIDPYALGFAMYSELKRMCEDPTDEDR